MKTYQVEIRYIAFANYTIEATSKADAEAQAWAEIDADPDHAMSYGEWELMSIEKEVTPCTT
jgi:hypothetical protein